MTVYTPGHSFPSTREPVALAARLTGSALLVGIVGGGSAALLFLAMSDAEVSVLSAAVNVIPTLVLVAMIAGRLGAARNAPSGRLLAATAVVGVLVVLGAATLIETSQHGLDLGGETVALLAYAVTFGATAGLVPSVICLLLLTISFPIARRAGLEPTRAGTEAVTTLLAIAVTAGFALLVVSSFAGVNRFGDFTMVALAAALAGVGANLALRWSLADRPA